MEGAVRVEVGGDVRGLPTLPHIRRDVRVGPNLVVLPDAIRLHYGDRMAIAVGAAVVEFCFQLDLADLAGAVARAPVEDRDGGHSVRASEDQVGVVAAGRVGDRAGNDIRAEDGRTRGGREDRRTADGDVVGLRFRSALPPAVGRGEAHRVGSGCRVSMARVLRGGGGGVPERPDQEVGVLVEESVKLTARA